MKELGTALTGLTSPIQTTDGVLVKTGQFFIQQMVVKFGTSRTVEPAHPFTV